MGVAAAGQTNHSTDPFKQLNTAIQDLTSARKDVQTAVDAALSRNELIRTQVHSWLARSGVVADMATKLSDEAQNGNRKSLSKWMCTCSFSSLTRLDKDKIETIQAIIQAVLVEKRAFRGTVSDVAGFLSRNQTITNIIEALQYEEISSVGIYGMAGVGKTVLLNSLYQYFKRVHSFQQVVTVVISKHPDLRRIQDNLANQLDLQLKEEDSTSFRANQLSEKIKGEEKVLVFLDDLWEKMDLGQVGIPYENCKIVITTRSENVCYSMAQMRYEVDVLSEEESLRLFEGNAGDAPDPAMAKDIVGECKGVPLAIVILGRALQGEGRVSWMNALRTLKKLSFTGTDIAPIFPAIEVSCDLLHSEATKMCFLFCCLFPEDFQIPCSTLLSYVVGEKLIENADTVEETQSSLNAMIEKLTSRGLLFKLDQDWVMMHDIVRDAALQIGFHGGNGFMVKAGMGLTEWPHMILDRCRRLSLMHNELTDWGGNGIPTSIFAPQLTTLSLYGNKDLDEIPDMFFDGMPGLLTLDLSETGILSLPGSFSCLTKLRTLCLDRCYYLNDITPIEKLGKLEILTLSQTQMQRLPEEMRRLVSLKLLDLSNSPNLVNISPGLISSLLHLEELNMKDSFNQWEVEGSGDGRNATLSEIATLNHLTCLRLCVANLECLSQDMLQHWESLKTFEILLGSIVSSSSP